MCYEGGKMYNLGEIWKGPDTPSTKNFSPCPDRKVIQKPEPIHVVEEIKDLPVTIPAPYEAPPPPVKPLAEMDYYELIEYGKTMGIVLRYKKPALIKLIQEKLSAVPISN